MRTAEAAGTFTYQPPEGEDQEFVDAPQQPETQGKDVVLFGMLLWCHSLNQTNTDDAMLSH